MTELAKYRAETSANDLLKVLGKLNACTEALDYYGQFAGGTVGQMVQATFDQSWASWYLSVFGKENETELCKVLIARIKDPMTAFSLYLRLDWLTDAEDELLEDLFKGKLPRAERELAQGIVKRAKWL